MMAVLPTEKAGKHHRNGEPVSANNLNTISIIPTTNDNTSTNKGQTKLLLVPANDFHRIEMMSTVENLTTTTNNSNNKWKRPHFSKIVRSTSKKFKQRRRSTASVKQQQQQQQQHDHDGIDNTHSTGVESLSATTSHSILSRIRSRRSSTTTTTQQQQQQQQPTTDDEYDETPVAGDSNNHNPIHYDATAPKLDLLEESIRTAGKRHRQSENGDDSFLQISQQRRPTIVRAPSGASLVELAQCDYNEQGEGGSSQQVLKSPIRKSPKSPSKTITKMEIKQLSPTKTLSPSPQQQQHYATSSTPTIDGEGTLVETPVTAPVSDTSFVTTTGVPPFPDSSNSTRSSRTLSKTDSSTQNTSTTTSLSLSNNSIPLSSMIVSNNNSPSLRSRRRSDDMSLPSHYTECMNSIATEKIKNSCTTTQQQHQADDDDLISKSDMSRGSTTSRRRRHHSRTPSPTRHSAKAATPKDRSDDAINKSDRSRASTNRRRHHHHSRTPSPTRNSTAKDHADDDVFSKSGRSRGTRRRHYHSRTPSPSRSKETRSSNNHQNHSDDGISKSDKSRASTTSGRRRYHHSRTPSPTRSKETRTTQHSPSSINKHSVRSKLQGNHSPTPRTPNNNKSRPRSSTGNTQQHHNSSSTMTSRSSSGSLKSLGNSPRHHHHHPRSPTTTTMRSPHDNDNEASPPSSPKSPKGDGSTHSRPATTTRNSSSSPKRHRTSTPTTPTTASHRPKERSRSPKNSPNNRKEESRSQSPKERPRSPRNSPNNRKEERSLSPKDRPYSPRKTTTKVPSKASRKAGSGERSQRGSSSTTGDGSKRHQRARSRSHSHDRSVNNKNNNDSQKSSNHHQHNRHGGRGVASSNWKSPLTQDGFGGNSSKASLSSTSTARSRRERDRHHHHKNRQDRTRPVLNATSSFGAAEGMNRKSKLESKLERKLSLTRSNSLPSGLDVENASVLSHSTMPVKSPATKYQRRKQKSSSSSVFDSSIRSHHSIASTPATTQSNTTSPQKRNVRRVPSSDYDIERSPGSPNNKKSTIKNSPPKRNIRRVPSIDYDFERSSPISPRAKIKAVNTSATRTSNVTPTEKSTKKQISYLAEIVGNDTDSGDSFRLPSSQYLIKLNELDMQENIPVGLARNGIKGDTVASSSSSKDRAAKKQDHAAPPADNVRGTPRTVARKQLLADKVEKKNSTKNVSSQQPSDATEGDVTMRTANRTNPKKGEKLERISVQRRPDNASQLASPRRKVTKSPSGTAVTELQELLNSPRSKQLKKSAAGPKKMDLKSGGEFGSPRNSLPSFQVTIES